MSTCKECKYFVKKEAGKAFKFNPQPFGQQKANPMNPGLCHLNPPNMSGQFLTVDETDWCSHCAPATLEDALNGTADELIE